jgi:hypothetical protein
VTPVQIGRLGLGAGKFAGGLFVGAPKPGDADLLGVRLLPGGLGRRASLFELVLQVPSGPVEGGA